MKSIVWVLMLTAAFIAGFIACNTAPTNNTAKKQSGTQALVPLANNEIYTCTMYNEVMSGQPGECC